MRKLNCGSDEAARPDGLGSGWMETRCGTARLRLTAWPHDDALDDDDPNLGTPPFIAPTRKCGDPLPSVDMGLDASDMYDKGNK